MIISSSPAPKCGTSASLKTKGSSDLGRSSGLLIGSSSSVSRLGGPGNGTGVSTGKSLEELLPPVDAGMAIVTDSEIIGTFS